MRLYFIYLAFKTRTKKWVSNRYALFITFCVYLGILSFIWLFIGRFLIFVLMPNILNIELASGYLLPFMLGMGVCLPFTKMILNTINGLWSWFTDTSWLDDIIAEGEEIYYSQKTKNSENINNIPPKPDSKKITSFHDGMLIKGQSVNRTISFPQKSIIKKFGLKSRKKGS